MRKPRFCGPLSNLSIPAFPLLLSSTPFSLSICFSVVGRWLSHVTSGKISNVYTTLADLLESDMSHLTVIIEVYLCIRRLWEHYGQSPVQDG